MHHVGLGDVQFTEELKNWLSTSFLFWLEVVIMSEDNINPGGPLRAGLERAQLRYDMVREIQDSNMCFFLICLAWSRASGSEGNHSY